jgi:hypothetical protein
LLDQPFRESWAVQTSSSKVTELLSFLCGTKLNIPICFNFKEVKIKIKKSGWSGKFWGAGKTTALVSASFRYGNSVFGKLSGPNLTFLSPSPSLLCGPLT